MIPGEIVIKSTEVEVNNYHPGTVIEVGNTGDRPVRVGSRFRFYEANTALDLEREMAYGKRLDISAGVAVRFEPGNKEEVQLVEYAGKCRTFGFHGMVNDPTDKSHIYRPTDENDEYAGVFGGSGAENVNKRGGERS